MLEPGGTQRVKTVCPLCPHVSRSLLFCYIGSLAML
jgi:hypothetical protein